MSNGYNIKNLIDEWEKVKKENPDPINRSFGDAIVRAEYAEKLNQKNIIPEGYQESLQRLHDAQSKLTPELLKKYPKASEIYNKAIKQGVSERFDTLSNISDNFQLDPKEMKNVLGEEGYNLYVQDLSKISKHMGAVFPGFSSIMGTQESYGNVPLYGLRSALLTQYEGEPRNIETVKKDIQEYANKFNKTKDLEIKK
jgi:hypothetical protein